jgi:hypothetical protein
MHHLELWPKSYEMMMVQVVGETYLITERKNIEVTSFKKPEYIFGL